MTRRQSKPASAPIQATTTAKQHAVAQRVEKARRDAFAPPYDVPTISPAARSAALAESLREGARVIVEMLPTFVAGVEAFARVFDVAGAAVAHLDPQSFAIAAALHEIAQKLPKPAQEVAADLRRVADNIDAGQISVN